MKFALIAPILLAASALGSNVQSCYLRFFKDPSNPDAFFTDISSTRNDDTGIPVPSTWIVPNLANDGSGVTFSSLRAVKIDDGWYCSEVCKLTVYSRPSYGGRSEVYYPESLGEDDVITFPFCAKSYSLDCGPYIPEVEYPEAEEEEEEEEEEEQGGEEIQEPEAPEEADEEEEEEEEEEL